MTTPPLDLTAHDLDIIRTVAGGGSPGDVMTIKNTTVLALLDRVEKAERAAATSHRDYVDTARRVQEEINRAEAAEAKVAAVRAVCDRFWPEELHDAVPRGVADSQSQIITRAILRVLDGTP